MFSFLIVRGGCLPRVLSVRRNLFGWMGWIGGRAMSLCGDLACSIGKFACEQLSERVWTVLGLVDGFFSYWLNLRV